MKQDKMINIFWFRRDLRLNDNNGLYESLNNGKTLCIFIFDVNILKNFNKNHKAIDFIWDSVIKLKNELKKHNSDLLIEYGKPDSVFLKLFKNYSIANIYANEDYEPYSIARDKVISKILKKKNKNLFLYKDHLIFAKNDIIKKDKTPYTKFTPYKFAWLNKISQNKDLLISLNSKKLLNNLYHIKKAKLINIKKYGFNGKSLLKGGEMEANLRFKKFCKKIDDYENNRNYPSLDATSYLGVDLRFGTISIRKIVAYALNKNSKGAKSWLSELVWREFFSQILFHYPYVVKKPFKDKFLNLKYPKKNVKWFKAWCDGKTGFPIIDAGMRQLNLTGYMHNRVRMICASFLVKDLLIDWKYGEKYFANKLLDYELSSNNGNWQWCSSVGCDAVPYFRIFNPLLQSKKFDPKGVYIRKYVSELTDLNDKDIHCPSDIQAKSLKYPLKIIEHTTQAKLAKKLFS